MPKIMYRRVTVSSLEIFYRETGPPNAPTLLLLHGFPTASHMFRDLMPRLADRFRMVAPDLPGFGQSAMPIDGRFQYTFECLAGTMGCFTEALGLDRFAIYVFDYGAPVGLRMALEHPERITAIISQNGNAYDEGLSAGWDSMRAYWSHPTAEYRESLRAAFTPEATRYQYVQGVGDPSLVSPDGSTLDDFYLARPGAHDVQLIFSQTTGVTSRSTPNSRSTFARTSLRFSRSGAGMTPIFSPPGRKRFGAICPTPRYVCLTPGTSHSKPIVKRLRTPSATYWKRELRVSS